MADELPIPDDPFAEQDYETIEGELDNPPTDLSPNSAPAIIYGGEPETAIEELPQPSQMTLGEALKHYRDIAELTQQQVMDAIGYDQSNLSNAEADQVKPNHGTLGKLAALYAKHIEGQTRTRIIEHLIAARDAKPMHDLPLPELMVINDQLRAYPRFYQRLVLRGLLGQFNIAKEIWKYFRRR